MPLFNDKEQKVLRFLHKVYVSGHRGMINYPNGSPDDCSSDPCPNEKVARLGGVYGGWVPFF